MLEISTLELLLKHQGAKLCRLQVTRYSEPQNASSLLVAGLQRLDIFDLNTEEGCEWPSKLIVHNHNTLRRLHLGVRSKVARENPGDMRTIQHRLPTSFAKWAKEASIASEWEEMPTLSLQTFGLHGLNLENVMEGALGLEINFSSLTSLILASCSGLDQGFALLTGHDGSQKTKLSALKCLTVRHEDGSQLFARHLTAFLTSLFGLNHLCVMLDGCGSAVFQEEILDVHGKTLRTLVWEERSGPRTYAHVDTSLRCWGQLGQVFRKCRNLRVLGLSFHWRSIADPSSGSYLVVFSPHRVSFLANEGTNLLTSSANFYRG